MEPNQVDGLKLHPEIGPPRNLQEVEEEEEVSSGDASKLYELVCEENNESPRGYTTFWKYLKHLEAEGLIVSRSSSSNRGRGRTSYITMPNSVPAVIAGRIENELLRR